MSKPNSTFAIGDWVTVNCPGHRQDGRTGTISDFGKFLGTWGVEIDGYTYGFLPDELSEATQEEP